tara:strand:- start:15676 stop:16431 length:756 start_codon:yes stop_codon:yes gene_type:complete
MRSGKFGFLKSFSAAPPAGGDPFWANVISLLHFDDSLGATSFYDSKLGANWTGGGAIVSVPAAMGGRELKLSRTDSNGVYPPSGPGSSYDYNVLAEKFSLEFTHTWGPNARIWIYAIGGGAASWGGGNVQIDLLINTTSDYRIGLEIRSGGSTPIKTLSGPLSPTGRHKIGLFRDDDNYYFLINGVLIGTIPVATVPSTGITGERFVTVGALGGGLTSLISDAYFDEMRFTRGVARQTAAYTPDTDPFPNF